MNKKTLIIGSSVLGLIAIGYFVFRKKKTATNDVGTSSDLIVEDEPSSDTPSKNDTPPKKNSTPVKQNTPTNNADAKKIQSLKEYIKKYALPKKYSNKAIRDMMLQTLDGDTLVKNKIHFLQNWVDAIKLRISSKGKKGTTFLYDKGKNFGTDIFDSYTGSEQAKASLINSMVIGANTGGKAYDEPRLKSLNISYNKGDKIGIVKGVWYSIDDLELFAYIPDPQFSKLVVFPKWVRAIEVTRQKK